MANEEHLAILKQGVEVWNRWREVNLDIIPDLRKANLGGMDLRGAFLLGADLVGADFGEAIFNEADLSMANLSGAILRMADLSGVDLRGADLRGADLTWTNLGGANIMRANLTEANLSNSRLLRTDLHGAELMRADLSEASFIRTILSEANLRDANLRGAVLEGALFADVDLSRVKGLETVRHLGPSMIGISTLYRSQGKIPEIFLRGAGVPDEFIQYVPSLISGKAIQYYSCFISYSTRDQEFADRLHADLQSKGVRCWFAPEDIKGGMKLHEQIPEAIRLYDKLLLVLSENSMRSKWVEAEIIHAREGEKRENRRKLFPIGLAEYSTIREWEAFNADTGEDLAREIRKYHIPDFSKWGEDEESYKIAFERLLEDLSLEENKP